MSAPPSLNWRIAFSDKTTGVAAVPQCLTSGDVFGDGAHRILIVSLDQKLICFEGQRMTHETTIPDMPSSVVVHYSGNSANGIPLVAVGAGNAIFFFLNLRQYSKFTLPYHFKSVEEREIYEKFTAEKLTLSEMRVELSQAKQQNVALTAQSLAFIDADLSTTESEEHWKSVWKDGSATDYVTALATLKCNALQDDRSTRLLVGTESRMLMMLDSTDSKIEKEWDIGAPASVVRASGYMSGNSMVVVVTRDKCVRLISNLSSLTKIQCESLPIDAAICSGHIYVALMSKIVNVYDSVGTHIGKVCFEHHIISLVPMEIKNRQLPYCSVATDNGELTFISKAERIDSMELEEGVSAMYFGMVGREPDNLLTISKHGGLFLRTLSRLVRPRKEEKEVDIPPVPIPKKTKLFVEKCKEEKKKSKEMYKQWRDNLRYIYMLSANTYAHILEESIVSPIDDVTFSVKILGMGPDFVLNVTTVNSGKDAIGMVKVIPKYNPNVYRVSPAFVDLPTMVGGYKYTAKFCVTSIDKDGKSDTVNIVATSPQFTIPLCSSIVQIPVSQFPATF